MMTEWGLINRQLADVHPELLLIQRQIGNVAEEDPVCDQRPRVGVLPPGGLQQRMERECFRDARRTEYVRSTIILHLLP
jgi:hypothetical protein